MAVELFASPKMDYSKGSEKMIRFFSHHKQFSDYPPASKVRKVIPLSNRTGHARFRRGPTNSSSSSSTSPVSFSDPDHKLSLGSASLGSPSPVAPMDAVPQPPPSAPVGFVQQVQPQTMNIGFEKHNIWSSNDRESTDLEQTKDSFSVSSGSSFMSSDVTGDSSVSKGKLGSSIISTQPPSCSCGKPPLSSVPYKKRCRDHPDDFSDKASGNCHCSKRRKLSEYRRQVRKSPTFRPTITPGESMVKSQSMAHRTHGNFYVPSFSGVDGDQPECRGYYKCSTLRGCPAKKHVERDPNDPTMLIVTYEGEHRHVLSAVQEKVVGGSKPNKGLKFF